MQVVDPSQYCTSDAQLLNFVTSNQIVAESAKLGCLTAIGFMVRQEFAGSWWSLPEASRLYNTLQRIRNHPRILVCRLLAGRVTYVHSDSWEPLLALENCLPEGALDRIVERHLRSGKHEVVKVSPAEWAPLETKQRVAHLAKKASIELLQERVEPTAWKLVSRALNDSTEQ